MEDKFMSRPITTILCLFLVPILLVGCATKRQTGALIGATAGGALGELIDDDGEEGLIIGAVAGGLIGYAIGDYMERKDKRQMEYAFENTPANETHEWTNANTGREFAVTPRDSYRNDQGRPCREFVLEFETDEGDKTTQGVTCQQPNGEWKIVESEKKE
jgi:surface antigen